MGRRMRGVVWLATFAVLTSGCSLFGAQAHEAVHWLTDPECAALSLSSDAVQPLMPVQVNGWPEHHDEVDRGLVVAQIVADGDDRGEDHAPILLALARDGGVAVPAPLHPVAGVDGGNVQIRIGQLGDGEDERWCDQAHVLRIDPLPAAGAGQGLVAQLDDADAALDEILAEHGTTTHELAQRDRSSLPDELVVPYLVAALLHHPDGLNTTIGDLSDDEKDEGDRLMAQIQRLHAAEPVSTLGEPRHRTMPASHPTVDGPAPHGAAPSGQVPAWSPDPRFQLASSGACTATDFAGITGLLGRQLSGSAMASGDSGFALDAAKFVGGLPVIGRVGLPLVLTAWTTQFVAEYLAGTLPSTLDDTDVQYRPDVLLEDDQDGGKIERITVTFTSEGFDPGPLLVELVVIAASLGAGKIMSATLRELRYTPRLAGDLSDIIDVALGEMMDELKDEAIELVIELVMFAIGAAVGSSVDGSASGSGHSLSFEPSCWDATTEEPDWHDTVRFHYFDAIARGPEDHHYVASQTGQGRGEARWELPIGQSILGVGLSEATRQMTASYSAGAHVEVVPLNIVWDPPHQRVEPGQAVVLHVQVHGAHDGRVHITDSLGLLNLQVNVSAGDTISYPVPADWDQRRPIEIKATSLANRGLRAPGHPAYRGQIANSAWLTGDDEDLGIHIVPDRGCVQPGEVVEFEAIDNLIGDGVPAAWSTDRGQIDADGRFTAPNGDGEITIAATRGDSEATAVLALRDPCNTISGQYSGYFEGSWELDRLNLTAGDPYWWFDTAPPGRSDRGAVPRTPRFDFPTPPATGKTGTFTLTRPLEQWREQYPGAFSYMDWDTLRTEAETVTVTLTRNDTSVDPEYANDVGPGLIEGTVTGHYTLHYPYERTETVFHSASFTIYHDPPTKLELLDLLLDSLDERYQGSDEAP